MGFIPSPSFVSFSYVHIAIRSLAFALSIISFGLFFYLASCSMMAAQAAQKMLVKSERHPFSSSDDASVVKQILATHTPDGREVDVRALLHIVEDVLQRSTPTVLVVTCASWLSLPSIRIVIKTCSIPVKLTHISNQVMKHCSHLCSTLHTIMEYDIQRLLKLISKEKQQRPSVILSW